MALSLTFLGTGGAFSDFRENYHNNVAVHLGGGKMALIDCGGTGVQSLKELHIPAWDVEAVIVTHLHGDHIGGIEQLAWERFYTGPDRLPGWRQTRLIASQDVYPGLRSCLAPCVEEVTLQDGVSHPGGFDDLFSCLCPQADLDTFQLGYQWGESVGVWGDAVGGVTFSFRKTPHVVGPLVDKPSYGVVMREGDQKSGGFYYTSDTIFRADIGTLFPPSDVDVIFHDCSFSPKYPGTVHTHYEELLTLPEDVRKRIVLMHHTAVPEGVTPRMDGFLWAAGKHDSFSLDGGKLRISGPHGGSTFIQDGTGWHKVTSIRVG